MLLQRRFRQVAEHGLRDLQHRNQSARRRLVLFEHLIEPFEQLRLRSLGTFTGFRFFYRHLVKDFPKDSRPPSGGIAG